MRRSLMLGAALLSSTTAMAQSVVGSGVEPAIVKHSAPRPIAFAASAQPGGALVIPMRDATLPAIDDVGVDAAARGALARAIADAKFEGKANATLSLRGIGAWGRILLVGTGTETNGLRDAGGKAAQDLRDEAAPVTFAVSSGDAAAAALGYALGQYRFDRYKTDGKKAPPVQPATFVTSNVADAQAAWVRASAIVDGTILSRDLATEPANVIYPESFVARTSEAFAGVANVKIEVLDEPAMRKLGMGSLIGVGQGSRRPSRLMIVTYSGGTGAPLAVVGKGITFDSGGISLKPGLGMWEMKADMSGAATAMGAALSLAKSRAPVNFMAVAALSENMPGGNAQRPGDVVRTMSGKTIEILNTDAEGRLVLADATEYVVDRYKPAGVVTIATLTGAIVAALDDEYAGLFARDEALATRITTAGKAVGEEVWRMPLHANYAEDMKSDIADIKNVSEGGRPGAGLAAHFVQYFVPKPTPHAHLDIAGVNWSAKGGPIRPKGVGSGWGVMLLDTMARDKQQ
jgi:leucyl aminopeptidase